MSTPGVLLMTVLERTGSNERLLGLVGRADGGQLRLLVLVKATVA